MLPFKTELSLLALQSHAAKLSLRERRALILCDGKRSVDELCTLLGPDTPALVQRLCSLGYLASDIPAPVPTPTASAPAPETGPASLPASRSRRSLVAARLYMLDMLELQRHESAATHRAQLKISEDEDTTVTQLLAALQCLEGIANPSLAQRVRDRLTEVLPEPYLPVLENVRMVAQPTAVH